MKKLFLLPGILLYFIHPGIAQPNSNVVMNGINNTVVTFTPSKTPTTSVFSATLQGKVTNQDNESIPGAAVLVMELNTGTVTTPTGFYSFFMPPGLYRIQYSFIGCQTVEALINLPNDTTYKYNVQLNCEALAANVPVVTFKTIKKQISICAGTCNECPNPDGRYSCSCLLPWLRCICKIKSIAIVGYFNDGSRNMFINSNTYEI